MLSPGSSIGPYQVSALIGQGGMGEVFKAHDSRLGRDVALKVANEAFSDRFTREARAIAALNHTNICHLYDVGPDYLVMEFVEGATLQGPLPFDEALPIIQQLIDGIEAAHERNIIHRDLKPANIKITPDGVVKILDFGLAKAMTPDPVGGDVTNSPTLGPALGATAQGSILGTAGYMAPEQAKGKPADRRADIWAFGVIVYELLTGRQLFTGESAVEILGHVLHDAPDLSAVPLRARRLLEWCLEKDRKERLQAIGDARRLLREAPATPAPIAAAPKSGWLARAGWVIAAIAVIALAAVSWFGVREETVEQRFMHVSVPLPDGAAPGFFALSPDGRTLALRQTAGLVVRSLDSSTVRLLAGTRLVRNPFWSPDSRTIAFFADGALKTIPAAGGPIETLCPETGEGGGGSWSREGVILFATRVGALRRVAATGGPCTEVIKAEPSVLRRASLPLFLPDGRHFLYLNGANADRTALFVASLDDPTGQRLPVESSGAEFVPDSPTSSTGHLLFVRETSLMAQAFDAGSLQLSGDPFAVTDQVGFTNTTAQIAASASRVGTVAVLRNSNADQQLIWYDRSGSEISRGPLIGFRGQGISLAPDQKSVAFTRGNDQTALEARRLDLVRNQESRMFAPPLAPIVVWSPDSARVSFFGRVDGTAGLYTRSVSGGAPQLLLAGGENRRIPSDWSRDGRAIVYTEIDPKTLGDIWALPITGSADATPIPLVRTLANESQAQMSPDGKWLAYFSNESGGAGVYVRALTDGLRVADAVHTVSTAIAIEPRWRADGKELFYVAGVPGSQQFGLVAVPFDSSNVNPLGTPRTLFEFNSLNIVQQSNSLMYAPTSSGQRFVVSAFASVPRPSLDLLINWPASLKK